MGWRGGRERAGKGGEVRAGTNLLDALGDARLAGELPDEAVAPQREHVAEGQAEVEQEIVADAVHVRRLEHLAPRQRVVEARQIQLLEQRLQLLLPVRPCRRPD